MGFFYNQSAADARSSRTPTKRVIPVELMKSQACKACPANEVDARRLTPKMPPSGSDRPLVYVLTGRPTVHEDEEGKHLVGDVYAAIRESIPATYRKHVRFGHVSRCRAVGNKVDPREAICCSGLLERDIEETRPRVVVGLGTAPLAWALKEGALDSVYRGRMLPIKVGSHVCHYYCVQDPIYLKILQGERRYDIEHVVTFRRDLKELFGHIEDLEEPEWYSRDEVMAGITCLDGGSELHYESLLQALDDLRAASAIGIDFETNMLRPYSPDARILTCSLSDGRRTLAFPVHHPEGWGGDRGMHRMVHKVLGDFLVDSNLKVAHNAAFELEWVAATYDKRVLRMSDWGDSMAAAHTTDERPGALSLGAVTRLCFGFDVKAYSNVDASRILEFPLSDVLPYNALDAKWCLLAWKRLVQRLPRGMHEVYESTVQREISFVLMQGVGLHVDLQYAENMRRTLLDEQETAGRLISKSREVQLFERTFGRSFKLGGDDEIVLVRDIMKRDEGIRGSSYSVDEAVLSSIPKSAGIAPAQILVHRAVEKLVGTYLDPVLNDDPRKGTVIRHADGLIHTSYKAMHAESGRGASEDPNVQNYPKRKRKEVRGYIVTPDGKIYVFVACDYGQLEARVCAMASDDQNLVDALWTNFDIHGHWAERFVALYPEIKDWIVSEFEVDWDEKGMKTLRQEAKNKWVFPQFFGSSSRSCAAQLHLPEDIADDAANEFWDQFRGVKAWQKRTVERYAKNHYVETLCGRRRHGPLSYNQIINTPIQGTGADIVMDAQERVTLKAQIEERWQLVPPLNVHDDLSFYIPRATLVRDVEDIASVMCDCRFSFINVPILVEVSTSQYRWHEMTEIGVYRSDELGFHSR